jgi:hypothetical protein
MFKLTGRILDWVDEGESLEKSASFPLSFSNFALILEDYEGKIGRKYPINTQDEVEASMGSFEKYASRLMPLHRRTAATFMSKACAKYNMPVTEKIAMYSDDSINTRTVTYKSALSDYEPQRLVKEASSVISTIANLPAEKNLDFGVSTSFVKTASYELVAMLKENDVCNNRDNVIIGLRKLAQDGVPMAAEDLLKIANDVCKISEISINRTMFRDPLKWPREVIEKEASSDTLDEFILANMSKLEGQFNDELLEKIAQDPSGTLSSLPAEISKIAANLLTSNE